MEIVQKFIPIGRKNRPAHPMVPTFITVHETDNTSKGADAKAHANYLLSDSAQDAPVSWHFTVSSEQIYQHLPTNESAYHAGDGGQGIGNRQSIGIEICVNSDGNFEKAKANAQWLIQKLMAEKKITINNVVQHNKWTGKNCPRIMRGTNTWQSFIAGINKMEEDYMTEQTKTWQKYLITRGYPLVVDGNFGPATLSASMAIVKNLDTEIANQKKIVEAQKAQLQSANVNIVALTANNKTLTAKITQIHTISSI